MRGGLVCARVLGQTEYRLKDVVVRLDDGAVGRNIGWTRIVSVAKEYGFRLRRWRL